jgi:hypothetical protein
MDLSHLHETLSFTGTDKGMNLRQKDSLVDLLEEHREKGFKRFVHGGCVGSDEIAHILTFNRGYFTIVYPGHIPNKRAKIIGADQMHPPEHTLERNKKIATLGSVLIATPDTDFEMLRSGTWHCIRQAEKLQRIVRVILTSGQVVPLSEIIRYSR